MGAQSAAKTGAGRNRIGACTCGPASWIWLADWAVRVVGGGIALFLPCLALLVDVPNGRVDADGSPG